MRKKPPSAPRQAIIRDRFTQLTGVSLAELAQEFGLSEMTFRRDVAELEEKLQIQSLLHFDGRHEIGRTKFARSGTLADVNVFITDSGVSAAMLKRSRDSARKLSPPIRTNNPAASRRSNPSSSELPNC